MSSSETPGGDYEPGPDTQARLADAAGAGFMSVPMDPPVPATPASGHPAPATPAQGPATPAKGTVYRSRPKLPGFRSGAASDRPDFSGIRPGQKRPPSRSAGAGSG